LKRAGIERGADVDEAAPPLGGQLESQGTAEAPRHGLARMGQEIGAPDGDGAACEQPQRSVDGGGLEGLCECERDGESRGDGTALGEQPFIESGEGDDGAEGEAAFRAASEGKPTPTVARTPVDRADRVESITIELYGARRDVERAARLISTAKLRALLSK